MQYSQLSLLPIDFYSFYIATLAIRFFINIFYCVQTQNGTLFYDRKWYKTRLITLFD
jgi:hypothetical protein